MSSIADILPDSVAPLVDRIISNPLIFVPARNPDTEVSVKPSNYIILNKSKESSVAKDQVRSSLKKEQKEETEMKKPRSMAEAVAAYTGKKFLTKAEKKAEKRRQQDQQYKESMKVEEEDIGEDLDDLSSNLVSEIKSGGSQSSDYESASEYPTEAASSSNDESTPEAVSTKAEPHLEDEDEEDDDEDDEDFNTDNGVSDESDSEPEISSSEDEDSEDDEVPTVNGTDVSQAVEPKNEENGQDDKSSTSPVGDSNENGNENTPPTSPEDFAVGKSFTLEEFYQLNESPKDRGSNGSTRILKNWKELSSSKPLGLLNQGVTCYTNSAMQAMIHIPAVQHYLTDVHEGKYDNILKPRSVSHVLAEITSRMWQLDNSPKKNKKKKNTSPKYVNPKKLISRLDDINCMMSEWQQEDSHEYFMSLLSRLQEDSTPKGVKLNESIIYDIFGGLLNQSVTCKSCGHVSETKQEFYDLSLGLDPRKKKQTQAQVAEQPNNSEVSPTSNDNNEQDSTPVKATRYSIENSLKDFFSPELIKTDKKDKTGYICEKCKQRTNALKVSSIDRAPESLAIHIKRFRFNGNASSKVKHPVSYSTYLDLTDYTTDGAEPALYQLISVIVHEGRSVSSGHYIAHCRQPDDTWATYDDEYVNRISEKEVLKDPSAYFLIYTRLTHKSNGVSQNNKKRSGSNSSNSGSKRARK